MWKVGLMQQWDTMCLQGRNDALKCVKNKIILHYVDVYGRIGELVEFLSSPPSSSSRYGGTDSSRPF